MSLELSVNGRDFDGVETKITMLGDEAAGVVAANYGFTREHKNNYSIGSDEPSNFSMGAKIYDEGSMTMYMSLASKLENLADGDITKMKPFKQYFTYLNGEDEIVQDEVTWKFSSWGREVTIEGDGSGKEFSMHIISVKPNIK